MRAECESNLIAREIQARVLPGLICRLIGAAASQPRGAPEVVLLGQATVEHICFQIPSIWIQVHHVLDVSVDNADPNHQSQADCLSHHHGWHQRLLNNIGVGINRFDSLVYN